MKKKLSIKKLSSILYYSFFFIRREEFTLYGVDFSHPRKSYTSGGGLYPVDLYLYIENTEDVSDGYYEYIPTQNCLKIF